MKVTVKANSWAHFKPHWLFWQMLGITLNNNKRINVHLCCSIALNFIITFCYPLHLALHLFRSDSMADNIQNLAVCITCVACSMKFIIYTRKLATIGKFEKILKRVDAAITSQAEMNYFKCLQRRVRLMGLVFASVYLPIGITGLLIFIFRESRSLLYPAWFPFNWLDTISLFILANVYQIVGILILLMQNYISDTFPAMALCMLAGHSKILGIRIANLGYNEQLSLQENEEALKQCVKDQQSLYELHAIIESIISWPIFLQFSVSATSVCLGISALLFFASTPLDVLYYFVYSIAMELQIFPTCYFGSDFQYQFDQLHYAIYTSNWIQQSGTYKKHMILFTERSLKSKKALAGGMVYIHLNTFFSTCQAAYSLLAVIMTMK